MADFDRSIENQGAVEPCRGVPCHAVGQVLRRAELSMEHYRATERRIRDDGHKLAASVQYLRDLEVIERCEAEMAACGGCPDFFGCMGRIQRG